MKKYVIPVMTLVFLLVLATACDDNEIIPDNPFAGGEWESISYTADVHYDEESKQYVTTTGKPYQGRKISFTENEFFFNMWSDNDNYGIYYNESYTGTYKLLPRDALQHDIIIFFSSDPRIDGIVYYDYAEKDQYTTDGQTLLNEAGSLVFYEKPNKTGDFIMGGKFNKSKS
jgi:hypothetical protein